MLKTLWPLRLCGANKKLLGSVWLVLCVLLMSGCGVNMRDGSRLKPLQRSTFFPDDKSSRDPPGGTVARGQLRADTAFFAGKTGDKEVDQFPIPVTAQLLQRGRERYNIYCSPCHALSGYGDGMIVRRGFSPPPTFHSDRLRNAPVGHFYNVITNGYGSMYSYASRVNPQDRWAIIAYIRALQLSQNARVEDVPADQRSKLQGATR
jgi:mono/diheme cytochrome c family protein